MATEVDRDAWFGAYGFGGGSGDSTPTFNGSLADPWTGGSKLTPTIDAAQLPDLAARLVQEQGRVRPAGEVRFADLALLLREGPRRGVDPAAILLARRRMEDAAGRGHEKAASLLRTVEQGVAA